jgi:hypothetical protein
MYESAPWVRDRRATRLLISMVSSQQQLWTFGKSRRSGSEQALFKNEAWSAPEIERERSQRKVSQIPVSLRLVISFSSCCKKKNPLVVVQTTESLRRGRLARCTRVAVVSRPVFRNSSFSCDVFRGQRALLQAVIQVENSEW